ncbi:MAG: ABC-type transporter, integral rane subunit [Gammaproteobacteria bacterium]|jgi:D-methionine transport system permease protein|nr:ABC-type transporter, integral rane subunit [Gammaproteobacteria bacterium]
MSIELIEQLLLALWETIYMVALSSSLATFIGAPLGIILFTTRQHNILAHPLLNKALAMIINGLRSIPFIILLVAIIPLTRLLVGTSIGTNAAIVPLTMGAIPFIARIVENALSEVSQGLVEAGLAMGATPLQIIRKILLPEAMPGIVNGLTITIISLIGYSAMAGAVGGGGLGDLAIRYGYQRFEMNIMLVTIAILIILVQLLQMLGDYITNKVSKHKL